MILAATDESVAAHLSQLGGYSGAVNRRPQQKAFSGKGHTLSSASDSRKVSTLVCHRSCDPLLFSRIRSPGQH